MSSAPTWEQLLTAVVAIRSDHRTAPVLLDAAVGLGLDAGLGVVACSITEKDDTGWRTPHWSAEVAVQLDRAQYSAAAGPCIDAADTGHSVRLTPIAQAPVSYATFAAAAADHAVLASMSLPVPGTTTPTALNFYAADVAAFDGARPQQVGQLLARLCGRLLDGSATRTSASPVHPSPPEIDAEGVRQDAALVENALHVVGRTRTMTRDQAHRWLMARSLEGNCSILTVARGVAGEDEQGRSA